jgi:hypothetical protein
MAPEYLLRKVPNMRNVHASLHVCGASYVYFGGSQKPNIVVARGCLGGFARFRSFMDFVSMNLLDLET